MVFTYIVSGNAYFAHFFLVSQNPKTLKQAMSAYSQARVLAKCNFVKASVFFLFYLLVWWYEVPYFTVHMKQSLVFIFFLMSFSLTNQFLLFNYFRAMKGCLWEVA
jgi:hypothetical protein